MNVVERNLPVTMTRASLDHAPEFTPPAGYSIRGYQPGDDSNWFRLHLAADRYNVITPDLFARQFGVDERVLCERQCYLLDARGHAIGTGTAWFNDDFHGEKYGRVHWMAIAPEYQGRGLGKPLMTAICHRLRRLGHHRTYLSTSTARVPAIKLYLLFGFLPLIQTNGDAAVWREWGEIIRPAGGRYSGPARGL